jgi:hypothetical protein
MYRRLFPVVAAAALAVAGAGVAAASDSHSVSVTLTEPTTVSGKVLPAGRYHISWVEGSQEAEGNPVDVTVKRNRKVVAEVEAQVNERAKAPAHEEVVLRAAKAGTQVLEEVRLRGDKDVLVFSAS